jgi:hypothetical protein
VCAADGDNFVQLIGARYVNALQANQVVVTMTNVTTETTSSSSAFLATDAFLAAADSFFCRSRFDAKHFSHIDTFEFSGAKQQRRKPTANTPLSPKSRCQHGVGRDVWNRRED